MTNRIEIVRESVNSIFKQMIDAEERRCAYIHLYGVAQACALLAQKRNENIELSIIAGMLHDIYSYANMDSTDHAHKGSIMAKEILMSLEIFSDNEINIICSAIYNHSDKQQIHSSFDELLKDADVMQHVLYNPLFDIKESERKRFDKIKDELDL